MIVSNTIENCHHIIIHDNKVNAMHYILHATIHSFLGCVFVACKLSHLWLLLKWGQKCDDYKMGVEGAYSKIKKLKNMKLREKHEVW